MASGIPAVVLTRTPGRSDEPMGHGRPTCGNGHRSSVECAAHVHHRVREGTCVSISP